MKILLFGKHAPQIEALVLSLGFEIVSQQPDLVLSYGGDGTLLAAEIAFPSIPKIPIRNSTICKKCPQHQEEKLLSLVKDGLATTQSFAKLTLEIEGQRRLALNDIVIRNALQMHAIRLIVQKQQQNTPADLIIGDGIVAATPFGSTGYFESITQQSFTTGFGLAFNNPTAPTKPLAFTDQNVLTITIVRGPATVSVDNDPTTFAMADHTSCTISAAPETAQIFFFESLHCQDCEVDRSIRLG